MSLLAIQLLGGHEMFEVLVIDIHLHRLVDTGELWHLHFETLDDS